jgi:hypothetical protein
MRVSVRKTYFTSAAQGSREGCNPIRIGVREGMGEYLD